MLAKEPRPGRVKTRLCPPCSPDEAAALAAASLADTLEAAVDSGADRVVVALDGRPGPWLPPGVVVVDQGTGGLDRRLATAWSQARGPALQVGMDTPQVTGAALAAAGGLLDAPATGVVFGPALDGGWWAVGMRRPDPAVFLGIATSRPDTGARQRARLAARHGAVHDLPTLRDVDRFADAVAVAALVPGSRFAAALAGVAATHAAPAAGVRA